MQNKQSTLKCSECPKKMCGIWGVSRESRVKKHQETLLTSGCCLDQESVNFFCKAPR